MVIEFDRLLKLRARNRKVISIDCHYSEIVKSTGVTRVDLCRLLKMLFSESQLFLAIASVPLSNSLRAFSGTLSSAAEIGLFCPPFASVALAAGLMWTY